MVEVRVFLDPGVSQRGLLPSGNQIRRGRVDDQRQCGPQDPPANVAGASNMWPLSRLIVLPAQSHHFYIPDCEGQLIASFVAEVNPADLDTSCLSESQPPLFPTRVSALSGS